MDVVVGLAGEGVDGTDDVDLSQSGLAAGWGGGVSRLFFSRFHVTEDRLTGWGWIHLPWAVISMSLSANDQGCEAHSNYPHISEYSRDRGQGNNSLIKRPTFKQRNHHRRDPSQKQERPDILQEALVHRQLIHHARINREHTELRAPNTTTRSAIATIAIKRHTQKHSRSVQPAPSYSPQRAAEPARALTALGWRRCWSRT